MYKKTSASVLMTLPTKMRLKMDANMLEYKMGLSMYHMY